MCRLFALSGGAEPVAATFWLLEAPDSLAAQSRREPDGTGLGSFAPDGTPHVDKAPIAAHADLGFAREAREVASRTFVAHIRFASTGGLQMRNTHPFEQDGRLLAHNGVIQDIDELDRRLGDQGLRYVHGDTDSERFFALISVETERAGGDVGAGIAAAAGWVAAHLPLLALNLILVTPGDLWALRYPETHDLLVLEREAGGGSGRHLDHSSAAGSVRVRSGSLADRPAVIVASEAMDADSGWRSLEPGELLHVDGNLHVSRQLILPDPPARPLTLAELDPRAAESQAPAPA